MRRSSSAGAARPSPDHLSSAAVALRFARPSRKMRLRRLSPSSSPVAAAATAGAGLVTASDEKGPRPARAERRGGPEPPDRAARAAARGSTAAIYVVVRSAACETDSGLRVAGPSRRRMGSLYWLGLRLRRGKVVQIIELKR
jgi:hypothetical protein